MTFDQAIVFATLATALVLFTWSQWRHDIVALSALLFLAVVGIVPPDAAYQGFGHPAVITVAAMLVISASLEENGIVDALARRIGVAAGGETSSLLFLVAVVTALSAFMNNVGALALMIPVALTVGARKDIPPVRLLMPVAFGSILGGLTTLIGTPPNIIIASFRDEAVGRPFALYDFAPVGIAVALAGVCAILLTSRFLLPERRGSRKKQSLDYIDSFLTEIVVPDDGPFATATVGALEEMGHGDINVLGLIRGNATTFAPRSSRQLKGGDILVLEADPDSLKKLVETSGVRLSGERHLNTQHLEETEGQMVEAVLMPRSILEGQTLRRLHLHARYGINVLAIARKGETIRARLGAIRFRIGDLILAQGNADEIDQALAHLGCLPVSGAPVETRRFSLFPLVVFAAGLLVSILDLVPIHISLVAVAVLIVAGRYLPIRKVYDSIDWAVIVLLAAMVPVGASLQSTGATSLIADTLLAWLDGLPGPVIIAALIIVAITLSNIINNAATAILMAPLSIEIAAGLGYGPDPFLMAVAVGSSCAFVLPIGHQSNLLVMGPGGYRFNDYWPLGTLVSLAVVCAAVPAILYVWPMAPL